MGNKTFEADIYEAKLMRALRRVQRLAADQLSPGSRDSLVHNILLEARISVGDPGISTPEQEWIGNDNLRAAVIFALENRYAEQSVIFLSDSSSI